MTRRLLPADLHILGVEEAPQQLPPRAPPQHHLGVSSSARRPVVAASEQQATAPQPERCLHQQNGQQHYPVPASMASSTHSEWEQQQQLHCWSGHTMSCWPSATCAIPMAVAAWVRVAQVMCFVLAWAVCGLGRHCVRPVLTTVCCARRSRIVRSLLRPVGIITAIAVGESSGRGGKGALAATRYSRLPAARMQLTRATCQLQ